jgi:hypothetical protein
MFWPCLAVEFNSNTFEKHTPEQIDSDSLRKAVYTRVFSGFKCFRIQSFYFFSRIQGFRIRPTTEMIFHRIRRCMCKRMYESDAKTFRFCDESGIFRSSVNGVWVSMLFLNSWRVSSHIVRYETNPPVIQKQHWHSSEAQIEPPLFESKWALRIQAYRSVSSHQGLFWLHF